MASFTCPFCGCSTSLGRENHRTTHVSFDKLGGLQLDHAKPYLEIQIIRCPNEECQKETVLAHGKNGYIENMNIPIYPRAVFKHFPNFVPPAIRQDYEEACLIQTLSPKAAATLARRCLQGMIHDYWGIAEKNLNAEITALKDMVPTAQWNAIDAVRKIGNIGAHMENDISVIVDVDPDEASSLIRLVELLIDKWYVARHDEEELYADLAAISKHKEAERKS